MKLYIDDRTLRVKRWFPIFDVLLLFVEDSRHVFDLDGVETLLSSEWLRSRDAIDRDVIRLANLKRSHDRLADRSTVIIDDSTPRGGNADKSTRITHLHPLDCVMFLSQPFAVIVENEWYDGSFLLWMAKLLGRENFIQTYRDHRFVFRHAGGKDSLARSASVLATGVWPSPNGRRIRATQLWACAVLDNDSKYPGHDPNHEIVQRLSDHVSFVHQLKKRSIESYLPHSALKKFDSSNQFKEKVDAFFRMNGDQRTHYHMKSGFRFKDATQPSRADYQSSADVDNREKALFSSVNESDWIKLAEGFGKKLSTIYTDMSSRPSPEDKKSIDEESRKELGDLIDAIYERI